MEEDRKNIFEEGQILLLDKPVYWTSFDLVKKVRIMIREILGVKNIKVGHAGTLDPLACGLMILCTGLATKRAGEYSTMDKEYIAEIYLGATTPSYDLETQVDATFPVSHITQALVRKTLEMFEGVKEQVPPVFSAKLIKGKRLYEYARKGISKEVKPVKVIIKETELLEFRMPVIKVRIVCSKGTYIRAFAHDLGKALNSGAYLSSLTRSAIGPFRIEQAMDMEKLKFFFEQLKQNRNYYV
ncbi:MAG: tRNA pseudouridine(55) synthase TruB [Bacteroidales bacterium]